jgi:hypothetical protein
MWAHKKSDESQDITVKRDSPTQVSVNQVSVDSVSISSEITHDRICHSLFIEKKINYSNEILNVLQKHMLTNLFSQNRISDAKELLVTAHFALQNEQLR